MYCESCGNELSEAARFCGKCGAKLSPKTAINKASEQFAAKERHVSPGPYRPEKKKSLFGQLVKWSAICVGGFFALLFIIALGASVFVLEEEEVGATESSTVEEPTAAEKRLASETVTEAERIEMGLTREEADQLEADIKYQHDYDDEVAASDIARAEKKEQRRIRIERAFSGWDGSHKELTRMVKAALNDPESFEHIDTVRWDQPDHIIVQMTYRARNGFGGMVPGVIKAKCSIDGAVLEVLGDE